MSLASIMREQEDERLARQLASQYSRHTVQLPKQVQLPAVDDEDEVFKRVLAESLRESQASAQPKLDAEVLHTQLEVDARLAIELQGQENRRAPQSKALTTHQQRALKVVYDHILDTEDDYEEEEAEDEEEGELLDEFGRPMDPRVHDSAQRREDAEISHVTKRMPSKMRNKIASTSGGLTALHHQDFRTRNKGKTEKVSEDFASRTKRVQSFSTFRPKNTAENEEYGVIISCLGGNHFAVLCYDNVIRQCVLAGKFQNTGVWFIEESFVLVKLRSYQEKKGQLILKYSSEEVEILRTEHNVNTAFFNKHGEALAATLPTFSGPGTAVDLTTAVPAPLPVN